MKHYLIAAARHKLKSMVDYLQDFCVSRVVPQPSLPAFPDIEWELSGETGYRNQIKLLARFFFLLGSVILGMAICAYLWQSIQAH